MVKPHFQHQKHHPHCYFLDKVFRYVCMGMGNVHLYPSYDIVVCDHYSK